MPKLMLPDPVHVPETIHPASGSPLGAHAHVLLGDAGGLTQFGAHLEILPPGSRSSHRHWHETEDGLVDVLAGAVWLIEDEDSLPCAGGSAAWQADDPMGHCFENRSEAEVVFLTVGTRNIEDVVHYPDDGATLRKQGARRRYTLADGRIFDREGS